MSKSTRSTRGGQSRGVMRAGFEYFDRRRQGPWTGLQLVFRGWGLLVPLAVAVWLIVAGVNPYIVGGAFLVLFIASFAATWLIAGLLIRSRALILVIGVLAAANWWFRDLFGDIAGNIILCVLVVGLLVCPPTRRFLLTRLWCVIDRWRMRSCLKACKVRTMNLDGALPLMLWARPTKIGERVWLWLRAGASGDDIDDALTFLAPACFARHAQIHRVRRLSTLVAVDIIRRDPLTGNTVPSPLAHLSDMVSELFKGEGTEAIQTRSVIEITATEPAPVPEARRNGRKASASTALVPTTPVPEGKSVVVSGEDLSDYID
jgi:hypothetical protein